MVPWFKPWVCSECKLQTAPGGRGIFPKPSLSPLALALLWASQVPLLPKHPAREEVLGSGHLTQVMTAAYSLHWCCLCRSKAAEPPQGSQCCLLSSSWQGMDCCQPGESKRCQEGTALCHLAAVGEGKELFAQGCKERGKQPLLIKQTLGKL